MIDVMMHEPFYAHGLHSEDRLNTSLGWVVQRNSSSDHMPVTNKRRDIILFFYGESFYRGSGARTGAQDGESIIQLYEQQGDSFLLELNGWFAGVLLDLRQERVLLFNDRYGMERIYIHESADACLFASEAKSLLQAVPSLREINPEAFAEYVALDCVIDNKSLFKGISLLPGGSCWVFDRTGRCQKKEYFRPESLEASAIVTGDFADRLEKLCLDIIPRYVDSHEPVAVSLTGGLDSRLILAAARNAKGIHSYTFAGDRDTFDVRQSRKVAEAAGLKHEVIRVEPDFFAAFPKLAEETVYLSDGTLGVGGTHNLYFNRIARKIAPVRLTGLFGSETLRQGSILSSEPRVNGLFSREVLDAMDQAELRAEKCRQGNPLTAALHRDIPWRTHGSVSIERSQITLRSPFMDNDLVEFLYAMPNRMRQSKKLQQDVIRKLSARLGSIISDHGDATDRNVATLWVLRSFLWALFKADYVYFFQTPDWFVKIERALEVVKLPRLVFGYQKFENYRVWYRNLIPEFVADTLLERRTLERPFFNAGFLREAVDDHLSGKSNRRDVLDKALSLELIMRTLIEAKSQSTPRNPALEPSAVSL